MKARAAAILIRNDKIALIERYRSGRHYFVFPGGKIEANETPAVTAHREIKEELGLEVKIGELVAEVWYKDTPQYYFLVDRIGGQFGHGTGPEMESLPNSEKGSHIPLWVPVDDLIKQPVLPKVVAEFTWHAHHYGWPKQPLIVTQSVVDDLV